MQTELNVDFNKLESIISTCDSFEQLINLTDWIDMIISPNRHAKENPEVLKGLRSVLHDKIKFQKEMLAGMLEEEMVDIMTSKHGIKF